MKEYFTELYCDHCPNKIGYIMDSGPRGFIICDECYEKENTELGIDDE